MSIRKVNFIMGEFYHIYNRGNSKQKIFHDKEDYERFVSLMFICNSRKRFSFYNLIKYGHFYDVDRGENLVSIGVYCLMPNHFHILITQTENGDISKFMQKITTAYVMYYNQKYKRTGSLFEGKFKSEYVSSDRYLKYLFSYIHLNIIKLIEPKWKELGIKNKKMVLDHLKNYKYSSFLDYLSEDRTEFFILNKKSFPSYFTSKNDFTKETFEWINYKKL